MSFMYKTALKKSKVTFFENQGNMDLFLKRRIVPKEKTVLLPGAGVNLDFYSFEEYPSNDKIHFLYLGRLMKEKGMDEFSRLPVSFIPKIRISFLIWWAFSKTNIKQRLSNWKRMA